MSKLFLVISWFIFMIFMIFTIAKIVTIIISVQFYYYFTTESLILIKQKLYPIISNIGIGALVLWLILVVWNCLQSQQYKSINFYLTFLTITYTLLIMLYEGFLIANLLGSQIEVLLMLKAFLFVIIALILPIFLLICFKLHLGSRLFNLIIIICASCYLLINLSNITCDFSSLVPFENLWSEGLNILESLLGCFLLFLLTIKSNQIYYQWRIINHGSKNF